MKWFALLLVAFALTACDYREVTREIGYKGKARINPWLAAERFCAQYHGKVRSLASWEEPGNGDAVWFVPAQLLANASYTKRLSQWAADGGHLIVLVDHASDTNDWYQRFTENKLEPPLLQMLDQVGIELKDSPSTASTVEFDGETYEVAATSQSSVRQGKEKPGVIASVETGEGRITVITDARIFRNRWIGDKQHAELLDALILATGMEGGIGFLRGAGLSLWDLLGMHLWPVLTGLGVLTLLWLWKNFTRFGPIEAATTTSPLRGYEHHLEALGDFQWRHDRAAALLAPLRSQIVDRGQRLSIRAGRRDDDFFQFLADLAGIPRDRAFRAITMNAPPDSTLLTRITSDLQRLLQVLH